MHLKRIRVHKKCIQYKLNIIIIIIEEGGLLMWVKDLGIGLKEIFFIFFQNMCELQCA